MSKAKDGLRQKVRDILREFDVIYQVNKPYLNMDDPEMRAWVEANDPQGMHQIEFDMSIGDLLGSHYCRMCMAGTERYLIIDSDQADALVERLIGEIRGIDPSTIMKVPSLQTMKKALESALPGSLEEFDWTDETLTWHAQHMLDDLKEERRWLR